MMTDFGSAVMGQGAKTGNVLRATSFQLETVYLMNFIVQNAHKMAKMFG